MKLSFGSPGSSDTSASSPCNEQLARLCRYAIIITACCITTVQADATLKYNFIGPDTTKTEKQFSVARFFARIDDPAKEDQYMLFQAGKFFPLYSVDTARGTYTRLTHEVRAYMGSDTLAKQAYDEKTKGVQRVQKLPGPELKPTKKQLKVAGIRCRIVHEIRDGKPVVEHCMTNSAKLGVTFRELITLSRLFEMSRNRNYGWLVVGTEDEEFVSIRSRDLRDNRMVQLASVSTVPLAPGYLRIPRDYKRIEPVKQDEPLKKN